MKTGALVLIMVAAVAVPVAIYLMYELYAVQVPEMKTCIAKAQAFQGNATMLADSEAQHAIYANCLKAEGFNVS